MKSINVRKLAAFTGAAILGLSAIAMADVVFGSTQLVDQNGQPTVKIVVGNKAAVSDGVAAANIAAKIANEAYKTSSLTAQVSGTPTCTVGTGVSGAGTCSIVESSKSVTLTVTVPGVTAGSHTFKTLISDNIDKMLANRQSSIAGDDGYSYATTDSDTSGATTSPLRLAADVTGTAGKALLYRIGGDVFSGFADVAVTDNNAIGAAYTEQQAFWVGAANPTSSVVKYSSNSNIMDVAVQKYGSMTYSAKFAGTDYGIPVCTGDLATNQSDDWQSCTTDSNSRTDRHRVKVSFMGGDWVISQMTPPTTALASSTAIINGGLVKLAKEAKYGIINVGQVLDAGTFKVRLSDISVAVGATNTHPAIIDILDANEAVVGQIQVDPGTTYTFTQSGTGNVVKVHVYRTAPGFTLNAKWAEMAIYTDEITLQDGSRYNLVSSTDVNQNFEVSLLWKNRDYAAGTTSSNPDSLRQIVVYRVLNFPTNEKMGSVENFLAANPVYTLTYNGVDLASSEFQQVNIEGMSPDSYTIANTSGDVACTSTYTYTNPRWLHISTPGANLLGGASNVIAGGYTLADVYYDPIGLVQNASGEMALPTTGYNWGTSLTAISSATALTNYSNTSVWSPKVFYKISGRNCYNWATLTANNASTNYVRFDTAGGNSAAQGAISFVMNTSNAAILGADRTVYSGAIILQEDAGKVGNTTNNLVYSAVPFITAPATISSGGFRFLPLNSNTPNVYYIGTAFGDYTSAGGYQLPFVSERGSKTSGIGTTTANMMVATRVGMPSFTFASSGTNASTSGQDYVMKFGDSKVFGGVTVMVKAIDATAGSCSVLGPGGKPACSVDSSSLQAVIQPDNQAAVTASQPYVLKSNLVVMDSEAPSAGVVIAVGGPMVNTVTDSALKGSDVSFTAGSAPVVKEVGNTIVVAGYSASDTMAAADQFISGVKRQ
ncbi:MAG: S-layer protein [Candidatus Micrarchaeota archaeon]|nr:S-layer protein [Candidatus Micrarchaeota archaeon]